MKTKNQQHIIKSGSNANSHNHQYPLLTTEKKGKQKSEYSNQKQGVTL